MTKPSEKGYNSSKKGFTMEYWSSRIGFILAAAGSAIGLGNIWRFPYIMASNGGAAFIIVYLILIFTISFSVFTAEVFIGYYTKTDTVTAFQKIFKNKFGGLIGWSPIIGVLMILSFYSVVGGWVIYYLFFETLGYGQNFTVTQYANNFTELTSSPIIPVIFHFIFMALTVFVVMGGVKSGIERLSNYLMPVLFILMIGLLIHSFTLPKISDALSFYFVPDWSKFTIHSLLIVLGQVMFTLSIGMGSILTYGSYIREKKGLAKSCFVVVLLNTLISLAAGLIIIPGVYSYGYSLNSGPGLTFITLPEVFDQMTGGRFIGPIFFLLLFIAALTSSVSLVEPLIIMLKNKFNISRKKSALFTGILCFIVGIGASYSFGPLKDFKLFGNTIFDILNNFSSMILIPVNAFIISMVAGWVLKEKAKKELISNQGGNAFMFNVWLIMLRFIAPIAIVYIFISSFM